MIFSTGVDTASPILSKVRN